MRLELADWDEVFAFYTAYTSPIVNTPRSLVGYTASAVLLLRRPGALKALGFLAPMGSMALTNYVSQSIVLGLIFYGYGMGLFGQLGSAAASPIGIALYATQVCASIGWLRRFRFGPIEWLWRLATYGHRPAMLPGANAAAPTR